MNLLASIPSPSVNGFNIGPLRVNFYGICIAVGVALAWSWTKRRFVRGGGSPEVVDRILTWAVILGFLGARTGYVITHTGRFAGEWWKVIAIWEGGLAFFGGLTVGALVALFLARRWGVDVGLFIDSAAPTVPLAQAFGRWGNYFNQELFGTPTDLPWGLEIERARRPLEYVDSATFHPTFLYESLLNLILVATMVMVERRYPSLRGKLIAVYLIGYGIIRFLMELLRTDTTFRLAGISRNGWISVVAVAVGIGIIRLMPSSDRQPLGV